MLIFIQEQQSILLTLTLQTSDELIAGFQF